jgi:hypothetical protein
MDQTALPIQDAAHKERAYRGLALHYLETGNSWLALHAQVAADMSAATVIASHPIHEVMEDDGTPVIAQVMYKLHSAMGAAGTASVSELLELTRAGIAQMLPAESRRMWHDRLTAIELYEGAPAIAATAIAETNDRWLDGLAPEEFVNSQIRLARKAYRLAQDRDAVADSAGASVSRYDADLSMFRAWLVARSMQVGDLALTQTEMKWDLAHSAVQSLSSPDGDAYGSEEKVRARLAWALGPADAKEFARHLG